MTVSGIDHVAIPVQDVEAMLTFYQGLGFTVNSDLEPNLYAVEFGRNRINFHTPRLWQSAQFKLRGPQALPGCGDFCFVWAGSPATLWETLAALSARIIEGPVQRDGGRGPGTSTYIRDPDGNLLEFIVYGLA